MFGHNLNPSIRHAAGVAVATLLLSNLFVAAAQPTTRQAEERVSTTTATAPADSMVVVCPACPTQPVVAVAKSGRPTIWPDLSESTIAWFAAIVVLALTLRRPWRSARNLDGVILAAMCLFVLLRAFDTASIDDGVSWQWRAYLGLTLLAIYWVARGTSVLLANRVRNAGERDLNGALVVLTVVSVALCAYHLATASLSTDSRDTIAGSFYMAHTGELPYGTPADLSGRSPLAILAHAGVVRAAAPTLAAHRVMERWQTWTTRAEWEQAPWWGWAEDTVARPVNAVLFALLIFGLYVLGRRLRSPAAGLTMVAVFCVFPGVHECLARPGIMLPATLLTWAIVFSLWRGIGGLLGTFGLVITGLAWPWAWLGLPLLLAYFFRRSWQALGSIAGLGAGVAVIVIGLMELVSPALPRKAAALDHAGVQPSFTAERVDESTLVFSHQIAATQPASAAGTQYFWRALLERSATPVARADAATGVQIDWPNDVNGHTVWYWEVQPTPAARPLLQQAYRQHAAALPNAQRLLVNLRTLMEATWLPQVGLDPPIEPAWRYWGGQPLSSGWRTARRVVKICVGLLVIWATLAIFFGRRTQPRHLLGAFLLLVAGTLLASASGAVTNLAWLMPFVVALWALPDEEQDTPNAAQRARMKERASAPPPTIPLAPVGGPTPRITVDDQAPLKIPRESTESSAEGPPTS